MTAKLSPTVAAYVRNTNDHDAAGFIGCFAEDAVVNDAGRELRGGPAIKAWSDHDIFAAQVTFDVLDATDRDGETIVRAKIDGNFDRTGLPDPLVMDHHIRVEGGKITRLAIQFAGANQLA